MNLSKKRMAIFSVALFGIVGASLSVFGALISNNKLGFAETEFSSCASIKFSDDFTPNYGTGLATASYDFSISLEPSSNTAFTDFAALDSGSSGLEVESYTCSKLYYDIYKESDGRYEELIAVKFGSSKNGSSLTINFNKEIVGATLYVADYATDSTVLIVNDVSQTLDKNYAATGTYNVKEKQSCTFKAYSYTFDATKVLNISAGTKHRFFLADIAIRVK